MLLRPMHPTSAVAIAPVCLPTSYRTFGAQQESLRGTVERRDVFRPFQISTGLGLRPPLDGNPWQDLAFHGFALVVAMLKQVSRN